jgi:hypothetical protein
MAAAVLFQPILMGAPREENLKRPRDDVTRKPE